MRLHRLTLQAIGPFAERHEVDLDELSVSGLFLLDGPTGSGKSTLIDAVVFALYGTLAGGVSEDRLHSDHAAPGVEPFVELVFSTGAGTFRVWRSPKHRRPKRRGDGETLQNARAKLWRLPAGSERPGDEHGVPISAHVQEVGDELARIVVLDRGQFTQTVVLPQGQFASFLHARPEDRRGVLQEIFGTEIYERLQQRLAELARAARGEVDGAAAQVTATVDELARAAAGGEDGTEEDGTGGDTASDGAPAITENLRAAAAETDVARVRELAEAACAAWEERQEAAESACAAAEREEQAARAALDAARDLAARSARRAALVEADRALREAADEVDRAAGRLDRARRAAVVVPVLQARERAAERRTRAAAAREQAAVAAGPYGIEADEDLESLQRLRDEASTTLGRLEPLVTVEESLPERAAALERDRAEAAHAQERTASLAAQVDRRPAERAELERRLEDYRDVGSRRERARVERDLALDRLGEAREAERTRAQIATVETELAAAAQAARDAVDAEHRTRRRWVQGMAGALAESLEPGRPCAVCGATEHPSPARSGEDHATDEDVTAAAEARERTAGALAELQARLTGLQERSAGLEEACDGLTVAEATERVAEAERAVEAAAAAVVRHAELAQELTDHDAETARLTEQLAQARTADAMCAERLDERARRLREDERRAAEGRGPHASVADRAARLRSRMRAARSLLEAALEDQEAAEALQQAEVDLAEALDRARLADAAAVRDALLPQDEVDALASTVDHHRAEVARVAAGLAEPGIVELTGAEEPAVEHRQAEYHDARARVTRFAGRASEARLRCRQVRELTDRLGAACDAYMAAGDRAGPVVRIAALAGAGDGNTLETTLATYVLLRRFEDVVAAANGRLAAMSDGRYALERIDEREGGQRSRKAGLGLRVRDHVTERPRDPHTLSGGETFYVSLCLALGLADVVRSEAGGIELGTLIIDEGFGSLDPQTLDTVMTELGRLREGGRAVGVVSHVTEMKDRIPERISVRRTPSGSSTLTVRC
ncbi:AAA family ATPase [Georgenia deserti]|uniref:Nuclease SbcCD subunit C n=1 Tax=Georgenia deserti TaxID=2093781 RepID=A0ABW4KZF3_9MICO